MSSEFEDKLKGTITAYANERHRNAAVDDQSAKAEQEFVSRFNTIVESDVMSVFKKAAELLEQNCMVQIHRRNYTPERPYACSVEMIITPKPGLRARRLRQPYPKLEICLKKESPRGVIFSEHLRAIKLELEEIDLSDLNSAKVEMCVHEFIKQIFE